MSEEKLKKASSIQSAIDSARRNIESLNKFKGVNEIVIMANDDLFKAFMKSLDENTKYSTKERPSPHYYSGARKDEIIDLVNIHHNQIIEKSFIEADKIFSDK